MIDVNITGLDSSVLIEVVGRVDSMTATQFGEGLVAPINEGYFNLVIDLSGVDYMSSAGLREIVNALKKAKREGGDLRIAQPSPRVLEVLEMAGLDTILQIFETQDGAVNSY